VKSLSLSEILDNRDKHQLSFSSEDLEDALSYGFSYVETEDHFVSYLVTNGRVMRNIVREMHDVEINPEDESIGILWTSKLMVSNKLKDNQIIFSNESGSMTLLLTIK